MRVTRDVEPAAVRDLLGERARTTVAFVDRGVVELLPARMDSEGERALFGVTVRAAPDLDGREVVLVTDDGAYWFELRGISVRGVARHASRERPGEPRALDWYVVEPRRVLAWNYDAIRSE